MKYIPILIFFISSPNLIAQQKNCFEIARKGTLYEMIKEYNSNNKVIDSIDTNTSSMLILACYRGNNDVAKFLIEKKANLNYVSENGTALMACTVKGNIELADFLLQKGSNPDFTDLNGSTALMFAVQFQNEKMIKLLLTYNADTMCVDKHGNTAFEYAVFSKNELIINLLK
jgi:ankyrin repeat protein